MELDVKSLEQDIYQEIQKVIVKANTVWMRRLNPLRSSPDGRATSLEKKGSFKIKKRRSIPNKL